MSPGLDALEVFVRVAELGSFTQAAQQPGMPKKARASAHLKRAPGRRVRAFAPPCCARLSARSGYSAWRERPECERHKEDRALAQVVTAEHQDSRGT
nr:LysR family transcriptional regulator [Cystobacter fuscus]